MMSEKLPKLVISPDFTLEDIRAIRTYNYEMTKNMTDEEQKAYYNEKCKKAMEWFHQEHEKYTAENENLSIVAEPPAEYKTKAKQK